MNDRRCYSTDQILEMLPQLSRRSFYELRKAGRLPWLQEITPRAGRRPCYRADLVDRYVAGQWNGPRLLRRAG